MFYIVVEGAGMGDSVRTVPCTGGETVMSAVGAVGGISQVSSAKIWIARPSPSSADKSAVLPVDWEAISKRGVNKTNYKLMPGDRLVFGEDPTTTRTNLLSKKVSPIERIDGIVSLTASTFRGVQNTPGGGKLVKDLIERNLITDDEQLKAFILDAVRDAEQNKKPAAKVKDGAKVGEEKGKPATATLVFDDAKPADIFDDAKPAEEKGKPAAADRTGVLELRFEQPEKPKSGEKAKEHEITLRGTIVLDMSPPATIEKAAPHELAMQPLPAYRIEPPDVLSLELLKLVPPSPYRGGVYDVVQIKADAPPNQPIDNYYMIEADGDVELGRLYGKVHVAGMTVSEMSQAVDKHLAKYLKNPKAYVQLAQFPASSRLPDSIGSGQTARSICGSTAAYTSWASRFRRPRGDQ